MIVPTASDIVRNLESTLEQVISPSLKGQVEKSAAVVMGHMLRHVRVRLESEGQILSDDIRALRHLLARLGDYLGTLDHDVARDAAAAVEAAEGKVYREAEAYPTLASLAEEAGGLRQAVQRVQTCLLDVRESQEAQSSYREARSMIQSYVAAQLQDEARIIHPSFEGFGPRR